MTTRDLATGGQRPKRGRAATLKSCCGLSKCATYYRQDLFVLKQGELAVRNKEVEALYVDMKVLTALAHDLPSDELRTGRYWPPCDRRDRCWRPVTSSPRQARRGPLWLACFPVVPGRARTTCMP